MDIAHSVLTALGLLVGCDAHGAVRERVVGRPCEGCEAVFENRPARLEARHQLTAADEPGEPLVLEGVVRDAAGTAVAGVIVYAYQTDASGEYRGRQRRATAADRHGALRGFVRSDGAGRYRFETIRPGSYPGRDTPQHIHMHVLEPGRCTYYIDDVVFTDDPLLTPSQRRSHDRGRGGSGVVTPTRDPEGRWRVSRDIVLGAAIPGYRTCGRTPS